MGGVQGDAHERGEHCRTVTLRSGGQVPERYTRGDIDCDTDGVDNGRRHRNKADGGGAQRGKQDRQDKAKLARHFLYNDLLVFRNRLPGRSSAEGNHV